MTAGEATAAIRSTIPARLDRLSWSPFHTRMVAGLELAIGIKAEGKSLEDITKPITSTASATEMEKPKPPERALPDPVG